VGFGVTPGTDRNEPLQRHSSTSYARREETEEKGPRHFQNTGVVLETNLGGVEDDGREPGGHLGVEADLDPSLDLVLALDQQVQHLLLSFEVETKQKSTATGRGDVSERKTNERPTDRPNDPMNEHERSKQRLSLHAD